MFHQTKPPAKPEVLSGETWIFVLGKLFVLNYKSGRLYKERFSPHQKLCLTESSRPQFAGSLIGGVRILRNDVRGATGTTDCVSCAYPILSSPAQLQGVRSIIRNAGGSIDPLIIGLPIGNSGPHGTNLRFNIRDNRCTAGYSSDSRIVETCCGLSAA